ncbi:class I SAM-dependent methyltransferase [Rhodomicrobium vannielii]|uniref:class I SAM-dependent methyltransferase n=1 Tax=Rhodomicrobium vannielii TaxID=1069 RepID=UPI001595B431|nr:class I SAM-dependent methyltransferase [Rhodomicrobium vannielii]
MSKSPRNPFAEAVLARVAFPPQAFIVDLACGLGRPSLEIAVLHPAASVLGVDIAPEMIGQARKLAAAGAIANARFEVMNIDDLAIASASADAAVSLFGLLQVGDPVRSIGEMARILKAGGEFSVAAYDDMRQHTLLSAALPVLSQYATDELTPPYMTIEPRAQTQMLLDAGLTALETQIFHCVIPFPSFEAIWQMLSSPQMFARVIATLGDEATAEAKAELLRVLARFEKDPAGAYEFPFSCRISWGRR